MWFREAAGSLRPRLRAGVIGLLALTPALLTACGGEDDFPNEPRAASPVELTAAIDDNSVNVSPSTVGAGLVNLTISNQTNEPTRLTLEGPSTTTSDEIPPGGTGTVKTQLAEGDYELAAGAEIDIKPATLTVGPDRPSSQNDLLQP
jgi:hypothetical protein